MGSPNLLFDWISLFDCRLAVLPFNSLLAFLLYLSVSLFLDQDRINHFTFWLRLWHVYIAIQLTTSFELLIVFLDEIFVLFVPIQQFQGNLEVLRCFLIWLGNYLLKQLFLIFGHRRLKGLCRFRHKCGLTSFFDWRVVKQVRLFNFDFAAFYDFGFVLHLETLLYNCSYFVLYSFQVLILHFKRIVIYAGRG